MTAVPNFEGPSQPRVDIVRECAELESLEHIWRDSAVAAGNLFVTPEWFFEYLDQSPAAQPAVVVARDDRDRPLAVLPLVEERRVVRFPGAEYGDRFEPLVLSPGAPLGQIWQLLVASLQRLFSSKLVLLERIDRTLSSAAYATSHLEDVEQVLPYIRLDGMTSDAWFAARTANFRSEVRRKRRALEDLGFRFTTVEDADSVSRALERHFDLHDRRWSTLDRASSLRSQRARSFHAGLAQRLADRGWLRLWFLRSPDYVAASWYGWNLGGRYSYYQAGFDPRWSRHSPGTLLLVRTIEAALDEGATEYDLLLGDEQYKARFTTEVRRAQTIAVAGMPSGASVRAFGRFAVRRLHRALPSRLQETTRRLVHSTHGLSRLVSHL